MMQLSIYYPTVEDILSKGIVLTIAKENEKWEKAQLGSFADKSGLYIHHSKNEILYIGITIAKGQWGNFAERMRREFQYSSSQNSNLFQILSGCKEPVHSVFYDFNQIEKMIDNVSIEIGRKTLILEQVLIALYEPIGNKK